MPPETFSGGIVVDGIFSVVVVCGGSVVVGAEVVGGDVVCGTVVAAGKDIVVAAGGTVVDATGEV